MKNKKSKFLEKVHTHSVTMQVNEFGFFATLRSNDLAKNLYFEAIQNGWDACCSNVELHVFFE